jgi:hypothetical protein
MNFSTSTRSEKEIFHSYSFANSLLTKKSIFFIWKMLSSFQYDMSLEILSPIEELLNRKHQEEEDKNFKARSIKEIFDCVIM